MEPISKAKFSSLIAQLRATFTRNEMTPEQIAVYYAFLKHVPERDLEAAVHHLIGTKVSPIFPTVAEIKLLAEGRAKANVQIGAMEAWNRAGQYLRGGLRDDPILNETVKLAFGGWGGFGLTDPENDFDRHRFVEAYQLIVTDDERMGEIKRLTESRGMKSLSAGIEPC
jgi:hypothetical protein